MKKILAAVKDTSEISQQIVKVAASIAKTSNSELYLIYVFQIPLSLPLDTEVPEELDKGDAILDFASEIADDYDISLETHIIQARAAGSGILNEIRDLKIDTAILGMKHNAIPGENVLGSTVEYVLKAEPCNLILIRPKSEQFADIIPTDGKSVKVSSEIKQKVNTENA
jgi:nucleotide-binding universal stress UspA family protein